MNPTEPIGRMAVKSVDIFISCEYIPIPVGPTIRARILFLITADTKLERVDKESFDTDFSKSLI